MRPGLVGASLLAPTGFTARLQRPGHLQVVLQFGQGFFGVGLDLRDVGGLRLLLQLLNRFLGGLDLAGGVGLVEGIALFHFRHQRLGLVDHFFARCWLAVVRSLMTTMV